MDGNPHLSSTDITSTNSLSQISENVNNKFSEKIEKVEYENAKDNAALREDINDLKELVKRSNAIEAASITSQLKSLQKISDLWAQGVSNAMTEFEKTENKGKTVETDKYSVKYTDKNNPVVVVNDDISRGVLNDKELVKAVKNSLSKFKYVPIDKQKIYFTTDTKKETTYSQYTKWLRNNKADVYQDKMRLLNHPVDVILATTNYVNEGLKHPRKDSIVDFARGNLLLDILGNKYEANVVIGFTKYGMCELYDIVNMKPTTFEYKKEASYKDSSSKKGLSQKGNASFNNIISTNTGKSQEKFSLKTNVEETKDLIAVHNLTEANLLKSLELGGLPMPSIAIIKAKSSHSRYGDISLVFNKSTIDPEASKYNKVYGGDAWTPTYPTIEYKANEKVDVKINKLYYDLAKKYGYDEARPLYNLAQDLEDELNRHNGEAGLIDYYKDNTSLMNLYLMESGKDKVQPVINEVRIEMSEAETEQSKYLIKALGKDIIDEIKVNNDENPLKHRKAYIEKNGEKIKEAYRQLMSEEYGFSDEQISNVLSQTRMFDYIKMIKTAYNYLHGNTVSAKTETDRAATDRAIKKAAGEGYTKWLNDLLNGAEEKSGIRNNVDYFTPIGNRRSFEALHWENNLENVVKAMREESATGNASIFSGLGIWGVSAKNYKSIEEIKSDKNRLSQMDEEEYKKIKRDFGERLNDIAFKIMDKTERNQFIAMDNAQECIVDAVRSSKTKSGILKNLKQYQQLNVTEADVDDIVELVGEISNMPTEYFEAKPQRAVGFNEVATAIIPNNSSEELKTALDEKGVAYREYEAGNEEARTQVLNSLEDVKFSEKTGFIKNSSQADRVVESLDKYLSKKYDDSFELDGNKVEFISIEQSHGMGSYATFYIEFSINETDGITIRYSGHTNSTVDYYLWNDDFSSVNEIKKAIDDIVKQEITVEMPKRKKAMADVMSNFNKSNVQYSTKQSFKEQVDNVLNNTYDKNNHVYMGMTPKVLTDVLGISKLPMLITNNHVYTMTVSKQKAQADNRYNPNSNYHDLGAETVKKIPSMLEKPFMLIKSNTDSKNIDFVVITNEVDKNGSPIMVAVKPYGKGNYFNTEILSNVNLSAYGKDNYKNYINTARNEGRILYINKSNQPQNTTGVQFPNNILNADYSNSISNYRKNVNDFMKKFSSIDTINTNPMAFSEKLPAASYEKVIKSLEKKPFMLIKSNTKSKNIDFVVITNEVDKNEKNSWEYYKVTIQEKNNSVWEATLNVANSANGKKILYDIYPIKQKERGAAVTSATSSLSGKRNKISSSTNIIFTNTEKSQENFH